MNAAHAHPPHVNCKKRREPVETSEVLGLAGLGGGDLTGFSRTSAGLAIGDSTFVGSAGAPPSTFLAACCARIFSSGLIGFDDSLAAATFSGFTSAPDAPAAPAPPAAALAAAAARIFSSGLIAFAGSPPALAGSGFASAPAAPTSPAPLAAALAAAAARIFSIGLIDFFDSPDVSPAPAFSCDWLITQISEQKAFTTIRRATLGQSTCHPARPSPSRRILMTWRPACKSLDPRLVKVPFEPSRKRERKSALILGCEKGSCWRHGAKPLDPLAIPHCRLQWIFSSSKFEACNPNRLEAVG